MRPELGMKTSPERRLVLDRVVHYLPAAPVVISNDALHAPLLRRTRRVRT